jgi:DNA/RNA endonuclease YhcR with UshA esterase domain
MERSESIINLSKGLAKFHSFVGKIGKDANNPFFKSSYASLPHILDEISEPMEKAGLIITQFPDGTGLITILIHSETGEYLQAKYDMPVAKANDPQALGSAISYARRYAVSSILSLKIADDDGEKAMAAVRKPEKEWLNKGEKLDKAMEYLKTGGKIEVIEKKYSINKEVREILNTVIKQL